MTICGTDEYMAPELFFDEDYNNSVDLFSFGKRLTYLSRLFAVSTR
jgi:serine/threonine protein kinase